MNERALADRTAQLPDMFADRVPDDDLDRLRSMARGGEWDLLLDELVAALRVSRAPVSARELSELRAVLTGWGLPSEQLADLVAGGDG